MSARPSWDGYLRFNLIAVPVKAYNAIVSGGGKIALHMVHRDCNNRIRYKKVCPVHGEVEKDQIATAYEFDKGKYVVVEPDEMDKLRTENDKAISIDAFVRAETLDPTYYEGRTYYLVPDGRVAQKPYAVLQEVMAAHERYGIAQVVIAGHEQIAVVRALEGGLLAMSLLNYADQIKKPAAFAEELTHPEVSTEERKLAETLIEASTATDFDLGQYKDEYTAKLARLIEAKTKGHTIEAPQSHEEPVVINLMDALRESLKQAQKANPNKPAPSSPARSRGRKAMHGHRRKTG